MELELKHIISYFNYGLIFYSKEYDAYLRINEIKQYGDFKIWINILDDYNKNFLKKQNIEGLGFELNKIMPLLKPLDLLLNNVEDKKHITQYSLYFIENNLEIKEFVNKSQNGMVDQALYSDVEYLLFQHYDIYNLILNNLAINKSKI